VWWCTSVIPARQKVGVGRFRSEWLGPGKKIKHETVSEKEGKIIIIKKTPKVCIHPITHF
jgi:hypothetical protein